jgi:hypothetical protein
VNHAEYAITTFCEQSLNFGMPMSTCLFNSKFDVIVAGSGSSGSPARYSRRSQRSAYFVDRTIRISGRNEYCGPRYASWFLHSWDELAESSKWNCRPRRSDLHKFGGCFERPNTYGPELELLTTPNT